MYVSTQRKGFTLLELMITVAVIGILAAISIPSYMSHMVKVRRAAAAACLMEGAQYAERYYTTNMKYDGFEGKINGTGTGTGTGTGIDSVLGCKKELEASSHYAIRATLLTGSAPTGFTLAAAPQGQQASRDTKCKTLTIDHTGKKEAGGPVDECW